MKDELRLKLKDLLSEKFVIDTATDFPDQEMCKVRGMIGQWAVLIEWEYGKDEETLYLETVGINGQGQNGPCLLDNLKMVLEGLS